ncbi:NAD-dependent succinate-semialdehyde dehydrogenase [Candidatus Dojkabacteria bacterium]|uniref:NAD-dependent succinate-semialdehyde dehydrogenase n=1 Tax=Candidatus Dojkabacteria bacterium TaxID=2099670 RepID=A0A3M0Z2V9_9BACT|nr:MAG: NAD-dependent succinate-semialdehyde dehydrogenase [Candidatus Dojkabacteria bacterium]
MLVSKNPFTGVINAQFDDLADIEIQRRLEKAQMAFENWKNTDFEYRNNLLSKLSEKLIENKSSLANIITDEIGQPIKASLSEIEKCAKTALYYEGKIEDFLRPDSVKTESNESMVVYEPLGVILGIVPWNFPFWMAFRFIIPTISAGNVVVIKHASNVPISAIKIEELMLEAGFPEGVVQTLLIGSNKVEQVIKNQIIKAISFSGSAEAGSIVASAAAREIKKSVLELGGSDPFIVFPDANLDTCSASLVEGRMRNSGQACNSPKRVFVHKQIEKAFVQLVAEKLSNIKMGDPKDPNTEVGPIATEKGLEILERQVSESISMGAKLIVGGKRANLQGLFFEPTILTNVQPNMPVFDQEIFGPVIAITTFEDIEQLITLSNQSEYGLGASIWTKDIEVAKLLIPKIEAGNVFINQLVRSDPRLPYGGIKKSGYGRELGSYGIKEFTNVKTIVVNYSK